MNAIKLGMLLLVTLAAACGREAAAPAAGTAAGPPPQAEAPDATSKDFGAYAVHFNAISTDLLTPEVAQTYGIQRSKGRALLNVSVLKKVEGTPGEPVAATVKALVANDTGQIKDASLREIREGSAVYYIADVSVTNGETLIFTIDATPAGETSQFNVRFTRTFYTE